MSYNVQGYRSAVVSILNEEMMGLCTYCGKLLLDDEKTIDHKTPIDRGGKEELSNYAICCLECNVEKSNLTLIEFINVKILKMLGESTDDIVYSFRNRSREWKYQERILKDSPSKLRMIPKFARR